MFTTHLQITSGNNSLQSFILKVCQNLSNYNYSLVSTKQLHDVKRCIYNIIYNTIVFLKF